MRGVGLALSVFAAGVLAVSAGASARTGTPALFVSKLHPLQVRGTNFRPAEPVTLTLYLRSTRRLRHLTASSAGRFTVSFGELKFARCDGFVVEAVGAQGSRATTKTQRPACMPVRSPG